MTKSDKRERAGAEKFLEDLIMYEYSPTCGHTDEDIDRVLRRDRRVRRKALEEAIEELEYLYEFGKYESDTDLGRGFRDAIDGLREFCKTSQ